MRNPFADDIFSAGEAGEGGLSGFQAEALGALEASVGEVGGGMGRALVVTSARAGYGKSHLMARFAEGLAGRAVVVPLTFDLESPPRWATVTRAVMEKVHRDHGHRAGLTVLDEAARYLFARVNQRLIQSRRIPCTHPAEAVAALDRNYLEMFDFANPEQVVARWFSEHFENLVSLSSESVAPEAGVEVERAAHWLRVLMAYAQGVEDLPSHRLEALKWTLYAGLGGGAVAGAGMVIQEVAAPEQMAKDTLRDMGRLLGLYRPLVFVIDHLDVFFRDGAAGLRIAYFMSELRRLLPRSLSVVCLNQDLWQATFASQLPSALEDRMSGGFVTLGGLTQEEARALLQARLIAAKARPEQAAAFMSGLDWEGFWAAQGGRPVSPRTMLRHAAACWGRRPTLAAGGRAAAAAAPPLSASSAFIHTPHAEGGASQPPAPGVAEMSASSVVGEETLDSISAALQAMVGEEAAGTPAAATALVGPFQRLREKLDQWKPVGEGGGSLTPLGAGGSPAVSPSNGQAPLRALAVTLADHRRRRSESPVPPTLDLERLGRLLRFAGDRFPAVRAAEMGVPGTSGTALQWLSPDAEILIGLESATRPIFWSALTAHAAARHKLNGGVPVKVVAFTEPDTIAHPAKAARPSVGFVLDLVSPSTEELQWLAAASDVLEAMDDAGTSGEFQEFASLLAQVLDPFWRRLTRVPAVSVG
ncbi:MAG: hypothetical protein ACKV19_09800 [Verrucomicrobiales bacterium]